MNFEMRGNEGASLTVEIPDVATPSSLRGPDANWLPCNVQYQKMNSSMTATMSLTSGDFAHLVSDLRALLTGQSSVVKFETMEEGLEFGLTRAGDGGFQCVGRLRDELSCSELIFSFSMDRSQTESTLRSAEHIAATHKVR